jgi:NadR type nicotinamide-nucleotide adenylyltransferase
MEKIFKQLPSTCIKVVFFGPESTGKTTLARTLAEVYNTSWVSEYARSYLEEKLSRSGKICTIEDMIPIAKGQINLENKNAQKANKFLFCDTNLISTQVYSEAYFSGWCDNRIIEANKENHYDKYFLTDIDVPFEQDLLRDRPDRREEMFMAFKSTLHKYSLEYTLLSGPHDARVKCVLETLNFHK